MASYTIPEEVIGIPLFVPDAYDYFSIESGGMPNGDDCLVIHGDVSDSYKAFQPVPSTSPNIAQNMTIWAISFWLKCPAQTNVFPARKLLCIENINAPTGYDMSTNRILSISQSGTSSLWLRRGIAASGSSSTTASQLTINDSRVFDNDWHLFVFNVGTNGSAWLDDDTSPKSTHSQSSGGTPAGNMFLCLGSYAPGGTGFNVEHRIGKLAFHDHHLNSTEIALLWHAMMGP